MTTKKVLMPRGTALWLKKYTRLTDKQIQDFCQLDFLTLCSLNDTNTNIQNPLELGQLSLENIQECEEDPQKALKNILDLGFNIFKARRKYFTQYQKSQRPSIVAWFAYYHPNIEDTLVARLLHSKISYIQRLTNEIKASPDKFPLHSPTKYGYCSETELKSLVGESNSN